MTRAGLREPGDETSYFGGRRPGELAQSSRREAVSARRAFFRSASFSSPDRRREALSRSSVAKEFNRSLRDVVWSRRGRDFLTFETSDRDFSGSSLPARMRYASAI